MKHFEIAFTIVMLIVTILSVSISAQAASPATNSNAVNIRKAAKTSATLVAGGKIEANINNTIHQPRPENCATIRSQIISSSSYTFQSAREDAEPQQSVRYSDGP